MRISHDPIVDTAYIYLVDQIESGAATTQVLVPLEGISAQFLLDFDSDGKLLGIEIVGARNGLRPDTLSEAEVPG